MKKFCIIAAALSGVASSAPAAPVRPAGPPGVPPTFFVIRADQVRPVIDRDIFGQFAEHLGTGIYDGIWVGPNSPIPNVRGIRSDVVAALRAIKVPNVRWPGGCFADNYHWRNGVGPVAARPATLNPDWGGVIEPNSFGTDEYMDFLGQIGADAFVSVNVGSGSVAEAADWFEYMTTDKPSTLGKARAANGHQSPYAIKYVGLGNENWGCGGAMSADHYVESMKQFARYVRNTNPAQTGASAMKRIAVGSDGGNSDYTEAVMKAWKDKVWSWDLEGVSLHSYTVAGGWPPHKPSSGFGLNDYAQVLSETLKMDALVAKQSAIMDKYDPAKKVGLYVDEWGGWYASNPGSNPGFLQQQNTLRDAILASLNFNIFMRHADRVRGTNIAQMINVLQAMILTDGPRMVLTPTYYAYQLYTPFQDAAFLPVEFDSGTYQQGFIRLPRFDSVAARDSAGHIWIALTNIDAVKPAPIAVAINGTSLTSGTGQVLTAPAVDSFNSFDHPNDVRPVPFSGRNAGGKILFDLPPRSVAVVQLR